MARCCGSRRMGPTRWRPSTRLPSCSSGILTGTRPADVGTSRGVIRPDGRGPSRSPNCRQEPMELKRGIAVAPGVAIGPALVLGSENFRIPQRFVRVDAVESEVARFKSALEAAIDEISGHEALAAARLG